MKKIYFIAAALVLLLIPMLSFAADSVRLKYAGTIYTDAEGGKLLHPEGVSASADYVFIADSGNRRVLRYTYKDGTPRADTVFPMDKSFPLMVHPDAEGNLFVLDGKDRRIVQLNPEGAPKGAFEPKGVPEGSKMIPRSFTFGANGNMYILDLFSSRVLILDDQGKYLAGIPFPEKYGFFSDVAVDRQGNIFLLDSVEAVVYLAVKGEDEFSALTGSLHEYMNFPTSLAPDNKGRIFLVDQYGSGLAIIGMDGSFLGRKLSMGWSEGMLYYPSQISFAPDGSFFIADRNNNRVQQFSIEE